MNLETSQEIAQRGQAAINECTARIRQLDIQMSGCQSRRNALQRAQESRALELATLQSQVLQAQDDYTQAFQFAQLAQGTAEERASTQAASAARRKQNELEKAYAVMAGEYASADSQATAQAETLASQVKDLQEERREAHAYLAQVRAATGQAMTALGENIYAGLLAEFEEKQAAMDQARAQLLAAQMDMEACYQAGKDALIEWPDIQQRYCNLQDVDDATMRVLNATLAYGDVLVRNGPLLRGGEINAPGRYGFGAWALLAIPEAEASYYSNQLKERLADIRQAQERYRARCQERKA